MTKYILIIIILFSFNIILAQGKFDGGNGSGYNSQTIENQTLLVVTTETGGTNILSDEIIKHIFPNPTTDIIHVNFEKLLNSVKVFVFNIEGKMMKEERVKNDDNLDIDFSTFPTGIYTLKIGNQSQKIVKK